MKFEEQTRIYREKIEAYLASVYAPFASEPQKPIFEAANYSLLAGGKRLRPILALEFCRMCGEKPEKALPFGAAVEMIHTYSLIHDDLPCMDNDDYRRGRLTNHKVYGEGMAVLAGDALLTDAFSVATRAELKDPGQIGDAIAILSECAGSLGMIGGQVLDIMSEERACTHREADHCPLRPRRHCRRRNGGPEGSRRQICRAAGLGLPDSGRYSGCHWLPAGAREGCGCRWGQEYLCPFVRRGKV